MTAQLHVTFAGSVVVPWRADLRKTTALLLGDDHCPSLAVDVSTLDRIEPTIKPIAHFVDPGGRHIAIFDLTERTLRVDGGSTDLVFDDPDFNALRLGWLVENVSLPGDPARDTYPGVAAKVSLDHGTLAALPPPSDALKFRFPYYQQKAVSSLLNLSIPGEQVPRIVISGWKDTATFYFKADLPAVEVTISALCGAVTEGKSLDVDPWNRLFGTHIVSPPGEGGPSVRTKNIYTCPPLVAPLA